MDPYKSKSKSKIKIEKEIFKNYLREIWSDLSKRDSNLPNEQGIPRSLFYRFIRLPLIISERLFNILAIENPNHLSLNEFEYGSFEINNFIFLIIKKISLIGIIEK